jgi:hypothetical protein
MMRYRKYGLAGLARDDGVDRGRRRAIQKKATPTIDPTAFD